MTKKELKELRKLEKLQQKTLAQKQNTTKWVAIAIASVLFLVLFIGLVIIGKNRNNPTSTTGSASFSTEGHSRMGTTPQEVAATDSANEAQIVTMVEYGDLQCPACKAYYPIVKNLLEIYPTQLKLVFKHFPLSMHPNAMPAALAAEAAGRQGKFFNMADIMYERQGEWAELADPSAKFDSYAKEIGLDLDKFHKDIKDPSVKAEIDAERDEGVKNGVNATPSFFIEGKKVENPSDVSGFQKIIDEELKAKGKASSQPTPIPTTSDKLPLSQ